MIELVYAERYRQNWRKPWDKTIQMKRDTLQWNKDNGFVMGGTWEGRKPENGLYKFDDFTAVKSFENNTLFSVGDNMLKGLQLIMLCTFQSDNTWQAEDYWYAQTIKGATTTNTNFKQTHNLSMAVYNSFWKDDPWFTNTRSPYMENEQFYRKFNQMLETQKDAIALADNDFLGFLGCIGGIWFTGRDLNAGTLGIQRMINGQAIQAGELQFNSVTSRKSTAFSLNGDNRFVYKVNYVIAPNNNTSTPVYADRGDNALAYTDAFKANQIVWRDDAVTKTGVDADYSPNMEGSLSDYNEGIQRKKVSIDNIIINEAHDPRTVFLSNTSSNVLKLGECYYVKEVDYYERKTTLFGVVVASNRNG